MNEPLVSIIIRTKNEEYHVRKTLSVLFSQTYKNIEVLIVDSGSTDRTQEITGEYPVIIHEISPEDFTYGYSLNYGFQRAKGEFIVSLSAHALPLSNNWIETLISNFVEEDVGAVMCKTEPWPDCNPFDRRGLWKKFNIPRQVIRGGPPYIFANYSSVIKKSVWEKIHFDEDLTYAEDHDWALKIERAGYKIIYDPGAAVYHSHNETVHQIYRRSHREALARKELNFESYSLFSIFFDLIAGTIYDAAYVLLKRDNIKWLFFAPLRRLSINYARLRAIKKYKT